MTARQIHLGKNAPCSEKDLRGHDIVTIYIWRCHRVPATHRTAGPLPSTVLTHFRCYQATVNTPCSVQWQAQTFLPQRFLRYGHFQVGSQKDRSVWASSTSFPLTLGKSKCPCCCPLRKNLFLLHLSHYILRVKCSHKTEKVTLIAIIYQHQCQAPFLHYMYHII